MPYLIEMGRLWHVCVLYIWPKTLLFYKVLMIWQRWGKRIIFSRGERGKVTFCYFFSAWKMRFAGNNFYIYFYFGRPQINLISFKKWQSKIGGGDEEKKSFTHFHNHSFISFSLASIFSVKHFLHFKLFLLPLTIFLHFFFPCLHFVS